MHHRWQRSFAKPGQCLPRGPCAFVAVYAGGTDRTRLLSWLALGFVAWIAAGCQEGHPDVVGVTQQDCVVCHQADYDATDNPRHEGLYPTTCADCHSVAAWVPALGGGAGDESDPAHDITIDALIPRYSATTISAVTPQSELLTMPMVHAAESIDPRAMESCSNCHSATGSIFPGRFHISLVDLDLPQPATCSECHTPASLPVGFVGPLDEGRVPATGAMKHDAVLWADDAPTTQAMVTQECGTCHAAPGSDTPDATWATGVDGASPVKYHAALEASGAAPLTSCVDCHANSRPDHIISSADSMLPDGLEFDHAAGEGMSDCVSCHTSTTSWGGGLYHQPGDVAPDSCITCHDGERPTSDDGWESTTYTTAPFDYGTNSYGITHGAGQDCIGCHTGDGTGGTETWVGGRFDHDPAGIAGTRCVSCHASQRPDLVLGVAEAAAVLPNNFDHSVNGTGDCFGCHQASVMARTYSSYFNASGALPGGDWKDGTEYPGAFVSSTSVHITVDEITLHRSSSSGLVTSMTTARTAYYNGMLHTSSVVPSEISPGTSTTMPDSDSCWHCHTSTGTTVTSYVDGEFHTALNAYSATPGGATMAISQPAKCNDCHWQMRPVGIVERAGSDLRPMDHAAAFTSTVTIDGVAANTVADLDCSTCHAQPGMSWDDGVFHVNIGSAQPDDCTTCHYPAMADPARADVTSGDVFAMKHRSPQITFQNCGTCHTTALGRAVSMPAWASWDDGAYHPSLSSQPTVCVDCHAISEPSGTTQSGVSYSLAEGGTATNGGQYMTHRSTYVTGRDCAACHASDARTSPTGWSDTTAFHAAVSSVTSCQGCHGLTNGNGSMPGTGNNMPTGATTTSVVTTASSSTGVSGQHARIDHSDINVTNHDCNFCHTQVGPGSGREWAEATFHARFTTSSPLVINTTTGRCSHCHANETPTAAFSGFDHTTIGTTDCSSCHSFPGSGTTTSPNWLGAMGGAPATISVGGFSIPTPPAPSPTTQLGIVGLPHPGGTTSCETCHGSSGGGRMAIGYDHASTLINTNCSSCHEAGSDLVSPVWNGATSTSGGAGDTRPYTLSSVRASFHGDSSTETQPNHFYPLDCHECHTAPSGVSTGTTGSTYSSNWRFVHNCRVMTPRTSCLMCHSRTRCE